MDPNCKAVPQYDPLQDKTSNRTNAFHLNYLVGSVSGYITSGTLNIGLITIESQAMALVNDTTNFNLAEMGNSGIIGFAFPLAAVTPPSIGKTLLQNIFEDFPFFAFHLGRDSLGLSSSSLTIGELDTEICNDSRLFSYTPVSSAGTSSSSSYDYWKLPLQGLIINSSYHVPLSSSLISGAQDHTPIAVLDTGTTMILGPTTDVQVFWNVVGSARKNTTTGLWEVMCGRAVTAAFVLGGKVYPVHPGDINWKEGGSWGGWCLGGVQANDRVNSGDWILGDVFLRVRVQ